MAVKCILTGQEKVNLSGDTMTGDLKVGSSSIGTNGYIEGTWLKTTKATESAGDFATISGDGWIYKRKPTDVLGDIGGQAKITANGFLKGDGAGNITAADETEVELVDLPQEVFWAVYDETTNAEIKEALQNGAMCFLRVNDRAIPYSSTSSNGYYNFSSYGREESIYRISPTDKWSTMQADAFAYESITKKWTDTLTSIDLPTASWTGSDPYTQTVTISGSTTNTKVDIQPSEELYDQLVADNVGYLSIKNVSGTLTAVAKGGKPSVDLAVQVTYNVVH